MDIRVGKMGYKPQIGFGDRVIPVKNIYGLSPDRPYDKEKDRKSYEQGKGGLVDILA